MRVTLLLGIAVNEDGKTCKDDDEHGGCSFNNCGVCALFLRPQAGPDADPTRLRPCDWKPVELRQHSVADADIYDRCTECLVAQGLAKLSEMASLLGSRTEEEIVELLEIGRA